MGTPEPPFKLDLVRRNLKTKTKQKELRTTAENTIRLPCDVMELSIVRLQEEDEDKKGPWRENEELWSHLSAEASKLDFQHGFATTGSLPYGYGSGRISSVVEAGDLRTSEEWKCCKKKFFEGEKRG
ncbi:hypothetical protein R1sor_007327 [Riccia sorocarpa]|uniref:Uncharacterized protein n=1 Tax=Riccia sorocarpa TaxID=122646 RepID=A0ABD3HRV1_9MARC